MLSVILPAYNEEASVPLAAARISAILDEAGIDHELIFIDDGSRDGTWPEIRKAMQVNPRVAGVRFSRNFGKEAAIFAGLETARGDCCAVMDCDLQHPPEKLPEMFRLWQEGYEVVEGVKEERGTEGAVHRAAANGFYAIISRLTKLDMASSSDFKLLDRKVVDALNAMPERNTFFRALSYWAGFRTVKLPYQVAERAAGESKWSTRSLIRYAVTNIVSFSSAPLQLVTFLGAVLLIVAVVFGAISLYQKLAGIALGGFTTVILLQLFTGSLTMISLGIIGVYIAQIYEEVKQRPRYLIAEVRRSSEDH